MSDFLGNCICMDAVEPSGDIGLRYSDEMRCVLYCTEYTLNRKLTEEELTNLSDRTADFWTDGAGSGFNTVCGEEFNLFVDYNIGERSVTVIDS